MRYFVPLAFSIGFALAKLRLDSSNHEASCSTDEVLEEHRAGESSLLAIDAGRIGRQRQAQHPERGPLGVRGIADSGGKSSFNPSQDTTSPGITLYPLYQPDVVDPVITTTTHFTWKPSAMSQVNSKGKPTHGKNAKKAKKPKVPMLKPAKKLTKKENQTRKKLALNCEVSDWSDWSVCEQKDDDLSVQLYTTRYRTIITPRTPPNGTKCNNTEEYMPCPTDSDMSVNIQDMVAGMGANATTEYGEPADLEDEPAGDGDGDGDEEVVKDQ